MRIPHERPGNGCKDNTKIDMKGTVWICGLNSTGTGYNLEAEPCECKQ